MKKKSAERLHGHNYKVKLEFYMDRGSDKNQFGYTVDFNVLKKIIKSKLDYLDEHVILPKLHPEIKAVEAGAGLRLHFRDREYLFPKEEVLLLPITNTSVEELANYLALVWKADFSALGIEKYSVYVEETAGQGAKITFFWWYPRQDLNLHTLRH